jgi:hypothetical protein
LKSGGKRTRFGAEFWLSIPAQLFLVVFLGVQALTYNQFIASTAKTRVL